MFGLPALEWDPELSRLAVDALDSAAEAEPMAPKLADRAILASGAPPLRFLSNNQDECRNPLDRWRHASDDHRLLLDPDLRSGACASHRGKQLLILSSRDSSGRSESRSR
jgi:hypothetical protein